MDVRFIIGTNANLRESAERGTFRSDLYWRLAVLMVRVPALVERGDEVLRWAEYMLARCHRNSTASGAGGAEIGLDSSVRELLAAQPWPGNLRQLDNVVRRSYAFCLLEWDHREAALRVSAAHVQRALYEETEDAPLATGVPLERELRAAARAFAREVKRRAGSAEPLSLACADGFRGLVLQATLDEFAQDKEAALEALGFPNAVRARNHHRVIKREVELAARCLPWLERRSSSA